jgi:hypothetical protein
MSLASIVGAVMALALAFGIYRLAQLRTTTGSLRFPRAAALLPPGRDSYFVVFAAGWLILTMLDVASGGSISHLDRFWVGTALGVGIGALLTALAARASGRR